MKNVWNRIYNLVKRANGMTLVETLVALAIVAVFATGITSVVVTSNATSAKADVISHFDRQNQMAIAEFKTNPDPTYLETKDPFKNMTYNPNSVSFDQHYDKDFQPTSAPDAPYYVSYQYVSRQDNTGFATQGTGVVMEITNKKRLANGTYEDLQTSAAQGTGRIHTTYVTNTTIDPTPSPDTPSVDPTSYRVNFIIEGGIFRDEDRDKRTVVVDKGTPLSTILPQESELEADTGMPSMPKKFTGWTWKKPGGDQVITADSNVIVNSDMSITGAFEGIPCTVTFKIPYYNGSWSNNPVGETASYKSQQGMTIDSDALAQKFGRPSLNDLFTGGVQFGGWFDSSGREFKTGKNGTVLSGNWDGKTVTAKVTVPSVTVKVSVTEGEAKGLYTVNVAVGGVIQTGDIAAATGKSYDKIQDTGRKTLSRWKRTDNGNEFIPGTTVCGSDWNNVTIETVYQDKFQPNPDMNLATQITDRDYWDITNSTYDFINTGGTLQLRMKEDTTKANTAPTVTGYRTYNLGSVDELKQKISDPGGSLKLNLNVTYNYYSVKDYLQKNTDKKLYFNDRNDQSIVNKFDGNGAVFNVSSAAVGQLQNILGITGTITLNPTFTKSVQTPKSDEGVEKAKLGMFLELGAVSPNGRKDNEQYKLMLKPSGSVESDGTVGYQIGIVGENGDNILDPGKQMDMFGFRHRNEANPPGKSPANSIMGTTNLPLGYVPLAGEQASDAEKYSTVKVIDQLTLIVRNRSGAGAGFRLEFKTEGPQSDSRWNDAGKIDLWGYDPPSNKRRQFDNVVMTPDSTVKVKHLVVVVQNNKDYNDKSVAFNNSKPVNENGMYGKNYSGYTWHGGWAEQYASFSGDTAYGHGWPTGYDYAGAHVVSDITWSQKNPPDQILLETLPGIPPLPGNNFQIK